MSDASRRWAAWALMFLALALSADLLPRIGRPARPSGTPPRETLAAPARPAAGRAPRLANPLDRLPLPIVPAFSKGPAQFALQDQAVGIFFTPAGIAFSLARRGATTGWGLHWGLVGARTVEPKPEGKLPGVTSIFSGPRSEWKTGLPTYSRLVYEGVAPGIDLDVESRAHGLKYGLRAAPGADVRALRFRYEGAREVRVVDDGAALEILTDVGVLREDGLACFQNGRALPSAYRAAGPDAYAIAVEGYDPAEPLLVDPTITWSSFLGGVANPAVGNGFDQAWGIAADTAGMIYVTGTSSCTDFPGAGAGYGGDPFASGGTFVAKIDPAGPTVLWSARILGSNAKAIAVDAAGNSYITGYSNHTLFPATNGFDSTLGGGIDAFVAKISASGTTLVWASYLGGSAEDRGFSIAVDAAGHAFITGYTDSIDFPVVNGFDTTRGGSRDTFVTKVAADGASLAWSTYLGGSLEEFSGPAAVDSAGNVYVSGNTGSSDFPIVGGFNSTWVLLNIFVAKIHADGSGVAWSTYLGPGYPRGMVLDAGENVYLAGDTEANTFPTTGGFDTTYSGNMDAFVAKINPSGSALLWSSYLGANSLDRAWAIALDGAGNAYVVGETLSTDLATPGAYDTSWNSFDDAFVAKINLSGPTLGWVTYLGGGADDVATGVAVTTTGAVCVAGYTASTAFPAFSGFDSTYGRVWDGFVTRVDPAGNALAWSSFLGGTGGSTVELAYALAVDGAGNAYVAGQTDAHDFPAVGAFDATSNGGADAFVAKIDASGAAILWSTYLGGSGSDRAFGLALGPSGDVYVTGKTESTGFPIAGGFDGTISGTVEGFVTRVGASGTSLVWSTFLGGSGNDEANAIAVDAAGNAYVTGWTGSADFPTPSGFDSTLAGGLDAFVVKILADGSAVAWGSYLGGTGTDEGEAIRLDGSGNVLVTGGTTSGDFPTENAFDATLGGSKDAFVVKVAAAGTSRLWATYLGGSLEDSSWGLAADGAGAVYVCGYAYSADFPVPGGFDTTLAGTFDAFVVKIPPDGSAVEWGTFLGGGTDGGEDDASDLIVVPGEGVYVVGWTNSGDFPVPGAFDATKNSWEDAFVAKLSPSGASLVWASFFGGRDWENALAVDVGPGGDLYVSGHTTSSDFPTATPFDATFAGLHDCFVVRIDPAFTPPPPPPPPAGGGGGGGGGGCGALGAEVFLVLLFGRARCAQKGDRQKGRRLQQGPRDWVSALRYRD